MLQAGKSVTQKDDLLRKVQPEYLYRAVVNPKPEIAAAIRQLRLLRTIDSKQYAFRKRQLPYVTCGIFNPPVRRTENFGWINHFILDLDHLESKSLLVSDLRQSLSADSRVKLLFVSPGEDGIKLMFQLKEKCYDAALYSLFYRSFALSFARQYQLEQVVDNLTRDVTRACFVSYDPEAYYNPEPELVDLEAYVDRNNPFEIRELKHSLRELEKEIPGVEQDEVPIGPDVDQWAAIREKLKPSGKAKKEKIIFVPEEVEKAVEKVAAKVIDLDIEIKEVINIHYGKKFRFRYGVHEAEVNLFYGKKGYTVVISPRQGTQPELNEICAQFMNEIFNGECEFKVEMTQ
jgi:hypothetical protein